MVTRRGPIKEEPIAALKHVPIPSFPIERFHPLLGDGWGAVEAGVHRAREVFAGRAVWHVNSTAKGGGVVELLSSLLAYARGAGVDNRWAVIDAEPEFFRITKRIHNNLHGSPGDGLGLGPEERDLYDAASSANAAALAETLNADDIVFLHDPQTAGMARMLRETGVLIVWRCHVGLDLPNEHARHAWNFLRPYVEEADAYVFSRKEFVWEELDPSEAWIVAPSIDVFSPKNQDLAPETVDAILGVAGLREQGGDVPPTFTRQDGTPGRVDRSAAMTGAPVPAGASVVTQVSRWDRLKDPSGVLRSFAAHSHDPDVHLVLAGPSVDSVPDDPEQTDVLAEVQTLRDELPPKIAERVHLACLPMLDVEENAAIVNALQRRSAVVVQKSIAEGFGLTVAEAMWKARPVVASSRGGIQDQIVNGESGLLIDDPLDLEAFGAAIQSLLADPASAHKLGEAAKQRVHDHFLGTRHLIQYLELLDALMLRSPH